MLRLALGIIVSVHAYIVEYNMQSSIEYVTEDISTINAALTESTTVHVSLKWQCFLLLFWSDDDVNCKSYTNIYWNTQKWKELVIIRNGMFLCDIQEIINRNILALSANVHMNLVVCVCVSVYECDCMNIWLAWFMSRARMLTPSFKPFNLQTAMLWRNGESIHSV